MAEKLTTLEEMYWNIEFEKVKKERPELFVKGKLDPQRCTDKLEQIFYHQKELQTSMGIYKKIGTSKEMKQQYINQMILALHEETVEIMRETAYKNPNLMPFGWKKGQEFNNEKFKEEIIDIIHFVMNLVIISGMDPQEMFDRYLGKNKENHERQEEGY